jgi:hypothetical protein
MYQEHFQLKSQPFCEHVPANSLWVDGRMQEGLARLNYLVEQGALGLVTGPTGTGKSALLKRFLHDLSRQQCESIYCHLAQLTSVGLLKLLVSQLGEVYAAQLFGPGPAQLNGPTTWKRKMGRRSLCADAPFQVAACRVLRDIAGCAGAANATDVGGWIRHAIQAGNFLR